MTPAKTFTATAAGAVNAIIVMLVSVGAVHWTGAQVAVVLAEANSALAFAVALYAHLAGPTGEPVAIAGTFTALVSSTVALAAAFDVWALTQDQASSVVAGVVAAIAVITALLARAKVTPTSSLPAVASIVTTSTNVANPGVVAVAPDTTSTAANAIE